MRARLPVLLMVASAFHASAQRIADAEPPRRLVQLSMAAIDVKGQPVTDLRASDLQLREDGKPRPLAYFRFDGSRRPIPAPAAGEFVNRSGITPTVILFDRWNERMMTAADALNDIDNTIGRMESVDRLYIYFLTNKGDLFPVHPLPPPGAPDPLGIPAPSPAELRAKLSDAVRTLSGFRNVNAFDPIRRANTTLDALNALGAQMASIAGRKNLVWVTHGFPLQVGFNFSSSVRKLSVAASQANLAIYTVDQSAQGAGADIAGESRPTLQMFAALTGGRWYPSGDTQRGLAEALADGRGAYRIAYYSPYLPDDRKQHKIRIESSRKGVRLQTRESYSGDEQEPDPAAIQEIMFNNACHSPFDAADIGLRVASTRDGSGAHFKIRVDPADLLLDRAGDEYLGRVGVMFAFYGASGFKRASPPVSVDVHLTGEQFKQAATDGIVIPQDALLNGQDERIRVIVVDENLHASGSVTIPVK